MHSPNCWGCCSDGTSICASSFPAAIVLVYIFMGGLTSAIYNEVLQFFLIVAGFLPLVYLGLRDAGGWSGVQARLAGWQRPHGFQSDAWTRTWGIMGSAGENPMGVEWFGMGFGLVFVLGFGYWCTDFLVVQRAMAARSLTDARRTPLIAAIPKMMFPLAGDPPGHDRHRPHTSGRDDRDSHSRPRTAATTMTWRCR